MNNHDPNNDQNDSPPTTTPKPDPVNSAINVIIADLALIDFDKPGAACEYRLPAVTFSYADASQVYDAVSKWYSGRDVVLEYPTGGVKTAVRDGDYARIFVR